MSTELIPFSGAVLCGGASRRMGRDKAVIAIGGRSLAGRVADAIGEAGADSVVAVGGDARALAAEGLTVVADREPGAGPLGGILGALAHHAAAEVVFVGACDLIAPSSTAIAGTVRALIDSPGADVAVPVVDGRRQWMHTAWRRGAAAALAVAFDAGERAVHAAVAAGGGRGRAVERCRCRRPERPPAAMTGDLEPHRGCSRASTRRTTGDLEPAAGRSRGSTV